MSLGKVSASEALGNLEVGFDDEGAQPANGNELQISEIRQSSGRQCGEGEDDMAEMEKLLKSGGAFGVMHLGNTFKKIRGELANNDSHRNEEAEDDMQMESELDMPLHDNSKLLMDSPGQNNLALNHNNNE